MSITAWSTLVAVFTMKLCLGARMQVDLAFHPESSTWTDAVKICRNESSSLAVVDNTTLTEASLIIGNYTMSQRVWTGIFQTPWITYTGCFLPVHDVITFESVSTHNSEKTCSVICQHTQYFGLQNDMCLCIDNLTNFIPTAPRDCDVRCPGNKDDICGGVTSITIMRIGLGELEMDDGDAISKKCLAVRRNGYNITSFHENCDREYGFVCRSTILTEETHKYQFTATGQQRAWHVAKQVCRTCQNCNGFAALPRLNIESGQTLWTEWSFNTSRVKLLEKTPFPDRCQSVQLDKEDTPTMTSINCSLALPFFCRTEDGVKEMIDESRQTDFNGSLYLGFTLGLTCLIIVICVTVIVLVKRRRVSRKQKVQVTVSHNIYSDGFSADSSTFVNENFVPYDNVDNVDNVVDGDVQSPTFVKGDNSGYIEFKNDNSDQKHENDNCSSQTEDTVLQDTPEQNATAIEYANQELSDANKGETYQNTASLSDVTSDVKDGDSEHKTTPLLSVEERGYETIEEPYTNSEMVRSQSNDTITKAETDNEYEKVDAPTKDSDGSIAQGREGERATTKRESFYDIIEDDDCTVKGTPEKYYAVVNKPQLGNSGTTMSAAVTDGSGRISGVVSDQPPTDEGYIQFNGTQ